MGKKFDFTIGYPVDMGMHVRTQGFGENPAAYKQYGLKGHNGDDLAPYRKFVGLAHFVVAADDGEVTAVGEEKNESGKYKGFGVYIELRHSWGRSLVAHLVPGSSWVMVGQKVKKGQTLAIEDSTGNSTGMHVHFQIKPEGEPYDNGYKGAVDPAPYYGEASEGEGEPEVEEPAEEIQAGAVRVKAEQGLRIRLKPVMDGNFNGYLPMGTITEALEETRVDGEVVYRAVKMWVAESEGGAIYLENVK